MATNRSVYSDNVYYELLRSCARRQLPPSVTVHPSSMGIWSGFMGLYLHFECKMPLYVHRSHMHQVLVRSDGADCFHLEACFLLPDSTDAFDLRFDCQGLFEQAVCCNTPHMRKVGIKNVQFVYAPGTAPAKIDVGPLALSESVSSWE